MAIMEISVVPVGTASASISDHVAKAVRAAKESGLQARVTPLGTTVTGDSEELMALAARMHKAVLAGTVARVITTIRLDERTDKKDDPEGRVREVEAKASQ